MQRSETDRDGPWGAAPPAPRPRLRLVTLGGIAIGLLLAVALWATYLAGQTVWPAAAGAAPVSPWADVGSSGSSSPEGQAERSPLPPVLVSLADGEGSFDLAYHPVANARAGVLWLSGIDGGIDGPFEGFYSRLAAELQRRGLASVQLINREPGNFDLSLREALLALDFARDQGLSEVAVVGFSFGGGVAIELAAQRAEPRTVVVLSGQGYGTDNVPAIAPRPILLLHAAGDSNIPLDIARDVLERAGVPAQLIVVASDDHYLQDVRRQVGSIISAWLYNAFGIVDQSSHGRPPLPGSLSRRQGSE